MKLIISSFKNQTMTTVLSYSFPINCFYWFWFLKKWVTILLIHKYSQPLFIQIKCWFSSKPNIPESYYLQRNIDLAWELKKLWNIKVTGTLLTVDKGLVQGLEDFEIRGRVENIQTTALLRSARILRRVPETWGELLSLTLQWKLSGNAGEQNSQMSKKRNVEHESDTNCSWHTLEWFPRAWKGDWRNKRSEEIGLDTIKTRIIR